MPFGWRPGGGGRSPSSGRSPSNSIASSLSTADLKDAIDSVGTNELDRATLQVMQTVAQEKRVDMRKLRLIRPLGAGGQGGVWLAVDPEGTAVAVKEVRKGRVANLPQKSSTRVFMERTALLELGGHPFLTNLHGTFQDDHSVYFAMSLAAGGDLFSLLDNHPEGLPEGHTRFYAACVALAFRHVHSHGYLYRDIKLENVLIGADGYAMLCDFGYAKKLATARTFTKCGTDEYAPPEVVWGRGRSTAADWWGLGILMHELLIGHPPFGGASGQEVFASIQEYSSGGVAAAEALQASVRSAAGHLSEECTAFVSGLLHVREATRIGCGPEGFGDVQEHAWFAPVDWAATLRKEVPAPWVPPPGSDGGSVVSAPDFSADDVMAEHSFDRKKWEPMFASFGPHVREVKGRWAHARAGGQLSPQWAAQAADAGQPGPSSIELDADF